jgi:hypothetical protein
MLVELPENDGQTAEEIAPKTSDGKAAEEQIEQVVEQEGALPIAIVYRTDWSTGREAYLDRVSPEVISQEWLAAEYGGGKYRVQFKKPEGGKMVYHKQLRFEVDQALPPKPPRHARPMVDVRNADGTPAGGSSPSMDAVLSSGILSLFTQQAENSRVQADFFRTVMAESSRKGPGIIEMITALTPLISPLLALVTKTREEKDPLDVALKLLELRGEQRAATGAPSDVMKTVRDVLEIKELFGGGGDSGAGPDPMIKLIETVAPQLLDTFKQAMALDAARAGQQIPGAPATISRPVTSQPSTPALASSRGTDGSAERAASEPAPTTQPGETVDFWKLLVGPRISKVMKLAEMDKNPVLYAQLEEDIIPEIYKPAAREFVAQENFVALIYTEYPQLLQYKEWFDEFFDVFAAALLGELDDDPDDETEIVHEEEDRARSNILREPVAEGPDNPPTDTPPASNNGTVD